MASLSVVVVGLFCASSLGLDPKTAAVNDLAWLAGAWGSTVKGTETEEHWIAPKGDMMLGVNRTVSATGRSFYEFLRIAKTPTGISYFASPAGRPATEFPMNELGDKKVVFENPKHDFPQRISYWIDKDGFLNARIEGKVKDQSRSQEWRWEKKN
jgi:hypothetical protein